jgi:hypothetical protein
MTSRSRLIVLLLSIPFVAFALVGGLIGSASAREGTFQHLRVFDDVMQLVRSNYVEETDGDKLIKGALRGLGRPAHGRLRAGHRRPAHARPVGPRGRARPARGDGQCGHAHSHPGQRG